MSDNKRIIGYRVKSGDLYVTWGSTPGSMLTSGDRTISSQNEAETLKALFNKEARASWSAGRVVRVVRKPKAPKPVFGLSMEDARFVVTALESYGQRMYMAEQPARMDIAHELRDRISAALVEPKQSEAMKHAGEQWDFIRSVAGKR